MRRMWGYRTIRTLCLVLCVFALCVGCGTEKSITGPVPRTGYLALTTPENTLTTMIRAYANRDTAQLALVYDDAYEGTSRDADDWSPETLTFTKRDEIEHVAALARSSSVASVSVALNPVLRRYSDA